MRKALVLGAGGFIGSHLVKRLKKEGYWVRGADLKYPEYSDSAADEFIISDLREQKDCRELIDQPFDEVYQLAADMGGAGYIFTGENDADVMHNSATINLNVVNTCFKQNIKRIFYSSSACIYPEHNQLDPNSPITEENSAYPANPDSEYGWEKLFSERLYLSYNRNHGMECRVARYHNIYGPEGTWTGGKETAMNNICLAGGVALNCVANGKLIKEKIFDGIWIQPASGDAGSALGASLIAWHQYFGKTRIANPNDSMKGTYLGCEFSNKEVLSYLNTINAPFETLNDEELFEELAKLLDQGKVIGWFNGPMEFGPRALGGRSIIGDPRNQKMQSLMNLKIKYRESFRPFAPSILEEDVSKCFELNHKSPYMLIVAPLKNELCKPMTKDEEKLFGIEKLNITRSSLPAITHIDYSARVQTVNKKNNPRYYKLIKAFKKRTNCPAVVNTSFNVRGEPIVCTPKDAYQCFTRTEMDVLVLENQILYKENQPQIEKNNLWKNEFVLD